MATVPLRADAAKAFASSDLPAPLFHALAVAAKLNTVTREKLLRELPQDFVDNGNEMPATDESLVEAVREMLAKLRRRVARPRRGAVSGSFDLAAVPSIVLQKLSVVG